jgi:hypothetical protein
MPNSTMPRTPRVEVSNLSRVTPEIEDELELSEVMFGGDFTGARAAAVDSSASQITGSRFTEPVSRG